MYNKLNYKIHRHINPSIKVGDIVRLTDGSALSLVNNDFKESIYIVNSYPKLTGIDEILKNINCIVVETNISDIISNLNEHLMSCYGVDIKVKIGKAFFYTCSKFLNK